MRGIVVMLARFAVWMARREAERMKSHRRENDTRDCMCDACGWERGLIDEADAAFGKEWRVMTVLTLDIPLAKPLPSLANSRLHWRALASLKKAQRHRTALYLRVRGAEFLQEWRTRNYASGLRLIPLARIACTLTRTGWRDLDGDNLQAAFKAIRDQVAEECGLDDGSKRWDWRYAQERGAPGYRIQLEVLEVAP